MVGTKSKRNARVIPVIIALAIALIVGVTFAWLTFRADKESTLAVQKVSLDVTFDMQNNLTDVATGDTVVESISFAPVASASDCYVRAKLSYSTESTPSDDDKRFLIAINYQDITTYSTASYKWTKGTDDYYYLTDTSGNLLSVKSTDGAYTFCEDVTYQSPVALYNTIPAPTDLTAQAKVQAIQTKNIADTSISNVQNLFEEGFGKDPFYGYIVTFDTGEGSTIPAQTFLSAGEKVTQPSDPVLMGQYFKGWFTDSEYSAEYDFNTVVTNNVTIFAQWKFLDPIPEHSKVFSENTPEQISAVSTYISRNELTSVEVYDTFGWSLGDRKACKISYHDTYVFIAGFNHDEKTDGTGKAGITLCFDYEISNYIKMLGGATFDEATYLEQFPDGWVDFILSVDKKYVAPADVASSTVTTYSRKLFSLSYIEIRGGTPTPTHLRLEGSQYEVFSGADDIRDRMIEVYNAPGAFFLRSYYSDTRFYYVELGYDSPILSSGTSSTSLTICPAFCI